MTSIRSVDDGIVDASRPNSHSYGRRRRSEPTTITHGAAFGIALAAAMTCILSAVNLSVAPSPDDQISTEIIVSFLCMLAWFASTRLSIRSWRSPIALWFGALLLFHLPIAIFHSLQLPFASRRERQIGLWLDPSMYQGALRLLLVFSMALLSGAALIVSVQGPQRWVPLKSTSASDAKLLGAFGGLVLTAAVGVWLLLIVTSLGWGGLTGGAYRAYVARTRQLPIGWPTTAIGFGMCMAAAGSPSTLRRLGVVAYTLFALTALPLGLRGEVLFPSVAAAAVFARAHPRVNPRWWPLAVAVLLPLLTLVGATRAGSSVEPTVASNLDPTNVLVEMGSSIRVPQEGLEYRFSGGDLPEFKVVIDAGRHLYDNILPAPDAPHRSMRIGEILNGRAAGDYGIGSSPVAEFYLSGGLLVMVVLAVGLGILLSSVDRLQVGPWEAAAVGFILFPLLITVRNEFVFVPYHLLIGLGGLGLAYWMRPVLRRLLLPQS